VQTDLDAPHPGQAEVLADRREPDATDGVDRGLEHDAQRRAEQHQRGEPGLPSPHPPHDEHRQYQQQSRGGELLGCADGQVNQAGGEQ
jgi:hypothetical protein